MLVAAAAAVADTSSAEESMCVYTRRVRISRSARSVNSQGINLMNLQAQNKMKSKHRKAKCQHHRLNDLL